MSLFLSCDLLLERQKGLTTSHLHTQLDPFASKLMMGSVVQAGSGLGVNYGINKPVTGMEVKWLQ